MTELHAFFDRDVYVKLACCDIWQDTLEAFGITHPYRLASASEKGARSALRRRPDLNEEVFEATAARVRSMSADVPVIPVNWIEPAVGHQLYQRMLETDGIDAGEAVLALVSLICEKENRLISGDKRFLQALSFAFPNEFSRLQPLILTFERCLLAVCELRGYEAVRDRLKAAKACDRALMIALGSQGGASYDEFQAALRSFDTTSTP